MVSGLPVATLHTQQAIAIMQLLIKRIINSHCMVPISLYHGMEKKLAVAPRLSVDAELQQNDELAMRDLGCMLNQWSLLLHMNILGRRNIKSPN